LIAEPTPTPAAPAAIARGAVTLYSKIQLIRQHSGFQSVFQGFWKTFRSTEVGIILIRTNNRPETDVIG
ncbi:hypothetical protein, partial [Scytonema sp. NUACC21]